MLEEEFAELDLHQGETNVSSVPHGGDRELKNGDSTTCAPVHSVNSPRALSGYGSDTSNLSPQSLHPAVRVTNPAKVGEGLASYIVYRVDSQLNKNERSVFRRFSQFMELHEKLCSKYSPCGIIVPPAPAKDVLSSTKVRISKDLSAKSEFVEGRRLALERYLGRLLSHPKLHDDSDLLEFLKNDTELPRSTNANILSDVVAKKMKKISDAIGKFAYKVDDPDEFFYRKVEELDDWDKKLKRLHSSLMSLASVNRDLGTHKVGLSNMILALATFEENTGLAQAFHHLAETEEEIAHMHTLQAEAETCHLVEYTRETSALIEACKNVLGERVRSYRAWKTAEASLRIKNEQKQRLESSGKTFHKKLPTLTQEISELGHRVEQSKQSFDDVSETIRDELQFFDANRCVYLKQAVTEYLDVQLQIHYKTLQFWEKYLSHALSIN